MALQHLRSSTANKRPLPAGMSDGQLAINTNTASPGLFFKDSAGALVKVGPVHVGTTAPNASPAAGGETGNTVGEQWLDTTGGTYVFKVWDGSAWRSETGTFVDVNGDVMTGALGIIAGSAGSPGLYISGDTNTGIYSPGADQLALSTNGTERARIDSSGRLLVGTSSARTIDSNTAITQIETNNQTARSLAVIHNQNSAGAPLFAFGKSRGGTIGSNTIVSSNDFLGAITFAGADGSALINGALIAAQVDGTPGTNDMPGRIVLSTTAAGASSPTERMRIDSSGRVGIGTTSPNSLLHVNGEARFGASEQLRLTAASTDAYIDAISSGGNLAFRTNGGAGAVERARIDSSGRLLVGTSSALSNVSIAGTLGAPTYQIQGATGAAASASITRTTAGSSYLTFNAGSSGNNVASGNGLGSIQFNGFDGTNYVNGASISAAVDGTPGTNDMPGRLVFSTTADGAASPTERMRISANGFVYIQTTATYPGSGNTNTGAMFEAAADGTSLFVSRSNGIASTLNRNSDGSILNCHRSGATVGSITVTTTATAFNTSSDYRLKENVVAVTDGIARLQQLKPSRFNFIADPTKTVDGFLAHEVQTVVPEAVTGEKDAVDDEGNPEYQGIDQSKLVPLLTAALQEAIGEIESLKARLTAAGI